MFDQVLNMPLILAVDFGFQKKTGKYSAIDNGGSLTNNLKSLLFLWISYHSQILLVSRSIFAKQLVRR